MKRHALLIAAMLLCLGCGDPALVERFRAERALWQADQTLAQALRLPPARRDVPLHELAAHYQRIGERTLGDGGSPDAELHAQLRGLAARAHFRQAQVAAALHDSFLVAEIYDRMAERFAGDPQLHARVEWSRGRVAEERGRLELAVASYRSACAQGSAEAAGRACLRWAQLAGTRDDWPQALQILRDALADSSATELRPELELRLIEARLQAGEPPLELVAEARDFQERHARSEVATRGLLVVAEAALADEADLAEQLIEEVLARTKDPEDRAQALMLRARRLESQLRWAELSTLLRSLRAELPITSAAITSHRFDAAQLRRRGDVESARIALERGVEALSAMMHDYPAGIYRQRAHEETIALLVELGRSEEAVQLLREDAARHAGSARQAALLVHAARLCAGELHDVATALELYEQVALNFPRTELGVWSSREAERLRSY